MRLYTDLLEALKGEPLNSVFSTDGTLFLHPQLHNAEMDRKTIRNLHIDSDRTTIRDLQIANDRTTIRNLQINNDRTTIRNVQIDNDRTTIQNLKINNDRTTIQNVQMEVCSHLYVFVPSRASSFAIPFNFTSSDILQFNMDRL